MEFRNVIPNRLDASLSINTFDFNSMMAYYSTHSYTEDEVYYYHGDHLGGANWITDASGYPVQHLQYLPFGENYINQRAAGTTYKERYTFTGKEKDEETGYGYFGARYMDHELMASWLSVDPMADKYPSISPYAYCAWNPVKLVDPDGMDIWDLNSNGELVWREASENDRIYARDGSYIDMEEGILVRGQSYTKDKKGFLFHLGANGGKADKIFEFFADNAGVEFSLIGYANTPDGKESQNFSLSCSFNTDGDTYGSYFSEAMSKMGTLRDHTHNHPDGDIWPSGIPSQEGIALGTWNPEEKGNDSRFVAAMKKNLKDSGSKGVFQAYIYCPRNSKKRAYPGGYRCYTNGENQGANTVKMHHQDILDKEVSMRCKYYFIIFFVTFKLLGCSQKNTGMRTNTLPVTQPTFDAFLEQFETLFPNDTMMDLTIRLFETDPFYGHSKEIDSSMIQYVAPIPPFFKASPSFKVKCETGWYVFLVHQYEVANIELKYIDVISYDFNGNMVSRMNLPFVDAHGGLYFELDEKTLGRGEIAISKNFLEYKWYCWRDHDKFIDTLLSKFKIFPNGFMKQVNVEETNKN